jgi:predicted membrane channel-forming protein YqfA (hemolysin III family)
MNNSTVVITAENRKQLLSNYQLYYEQNSQLESLVMVVVSACSNFTSLPLVVNCFRHGKKFEGLVFFCSMMSSFLYHLGEIYNHVFYLKYHEWHRLDNVFAIASFGLYALYMTGNSDEAFLTYLTLIVAILAQEKDPWNIKYTVWPIVIFFVLGLAVNIIKCKGIPRYNIWAVKRGTFYLLVGIFFFSRGLDEETDYLRVNHGLWHAFLGISSWYNFHSIKLPDYRAVRS